MTSVTWPCVARPPSLSHDLASMRRFSDITNTMNRHDGGRPCHAGPSGANSVPTLQIRGMSLARPSRCDVHTPGTDRCRDPPSQRRAAASTPTFDVRDIHTPGTHRCIDISEWGFATGFSSDCPSESSDDLFYTPSSMATALHEDARDIHTPGTLCAVHAYARTRPCHSPACSSRYRQCEKCARGRAS